MYTLALCQGAPVRTPRPKRGTSWSGIKTLAETAHRLGASPLGGFLVPPCAPGSERSASVAGGKKRATCGVRATKWRTHSTLPGRGCRWWHPRGPVTRPLRPPQPTRPYHSVPAPRFVVMRVMKRSSRKILQDRAYFFLLQVFLLHGANDLRRGLARCERNCPQQAFSHSLPPPPLLEVVEIEDGGTHLRLPRPIALMPHNGQPNGEPRNARPCHPATRPPWIRKAPSQRTFFVPHSPGSSSPVLYIHAVLLARTRA